MLLASSRDFQFKIPFHMKALFARFLEWSAHGLGGFEYIIYVIKYESVICNFEEVWHNSSNFCS